MIDITVVIPAKNEESNLRQCLDHLTDFREVVLVDSGSTDATVRIAGEYQAKVITFLWDGKFPKKRNWVLRNYAFITDWLLFLDADETLTPEFIQALPAAIETKEFVGYWLNYADHFLGRHLRYGLPMKKLALFKVGSGEYERIDEEGWTSLDMEVHEHPVLNGKIGEIKEPIIHHDCKNLHHYMAKHNEYSSWEARRYVELKYSHAGSLTTRQRMKYRFLNSLWFSPGYFIFAFFLRLGFLDGREGFLFAAHKAYYFFSIFCKIREIQRNYNLSLPADGSEKR